MRPRGGREETRKCGCIQLELSEKLLLSAQLRLNLFSITIKKKKKKDVGQTGLTLLLLPGNAGSAQRSACQSPGDRASAWILFTFTETPPTLPQLMVFCKTFSSAHGTQPRSPYGGFCDYL